MSKKKTIMRALLALSGLAVVAFGIHFLAAEREMRKRLAEEQDWTKQISVQSGSAEMAEPDPKFTALLEEAAARYAGSPQSAALRLMLENAKYREADREFWGMVLSGDKADQKKKPDLPATRKRYEEYIKSLDAIAAQKIEEEDWAWQVWNNRATAKVYQIFLGSRSGENEKKLKDLAKSALLDYLKAYDLCRERTCADFIGQNVDFLTRLPQMEKEKRSGDGQPKNGQSPDQNGEGGQSAGDGNDGKGKAADKDGGKGKQVSGLGKLFDKGAGEGDASGDGKGDKSGEKPQIFLPGTGVTPGKGVKGAH